MKKVYSLTHKHKVCKTCLKYRTTHTYTCKHEVSHLMMKSNSDPASMRTPRSVEIAPSTTGANMCSKATAERLFLLPIAVRKPCGEREVGKRNELEILQIIQNLCCGGGLAHFRILAFDFVGDRYKIVHCAKKQVWSCQHEPGSQMFPNKTLIPLFFYLDHFPFQE